MKRISIILFAVLSAYTVFATIPSGTTIYLDVSQHKCCYTTYMLRSDDIGICKKMTPVAGYTGLYSYKLNRSVNNKLRFAGTDRTLQINNGDELNYNIDDFNPWTTSWVGSSALYCVVTDENGTCSWMAEPLATQDSPLADANITMAYNCTKHKFVAGIYAEFNSTPCGVKISSSAMPEDKVIKKPQSPLSYTVSDEIALGETVTVTLSIYSDVACTNKVDERTFSAIAASQECSRTHNISFCMGTTATLTASLEGDIYEWSSTDPAVNGANTRSVKIPTDNLGKYTYSVKTYQINIVVENNLMAGGDFENEGIGFSSDYYYVGKDVVANYGSHGQDIYTLTQDVSQFWRDFASVKAHGGKYYGFFDAESKGYAWKAETNSSEGTHSQDNPNLQIRKGQKYYFSYWAAFPNAEGTEYFSATPATLQFLISYLNKDGNRITEKLGDPYTLSNNDHNWHQQTVIWTAPASSAEVMIAVYDTVTSWRGNDFCLDDIMFQNVSYSETNVAFTDYFEVTVRDCDLPEPCAVPVYRKWNDFLFVDNSDSIYTEYQWYCNGKAIEIGGNAQYYRISEPNDTDEYYVLLNGSIKSCSTTIANADKSVDSKPYPTKQMVAKRVYVLSPDFRLVVTYFDDGSTETEKQLRF